jgi:hypothetical protein
LPSLIILLPLISSTFSPFIYNDDTISLICFLSAYPVILITSVKYLIGITITTDNPRNVYDSSSKTNKLYEDVLVTKLGEDCIAKDIGVKVGDVIKSIKITRANGFEEEIFITRMHTLTDVMLTLRVGDTVEYCVIRAEGEGGNTEEIKLDSFVVELDNYAIYEGSDV